jgi:hypothetical protein
MTRTNDVLTSEQLMDLFGGPDMSPDLAPGIAIQVCDGEWRREGPLWRFWQAPDMAQP